MQLNQFELVSEMQGVQSLLGMSCLALQADRSPWVRDAFRYIPQRLGFIFK